jgi:hypothetical protein
VATYYRGDDNFYWPRLVPGDSVVITRRTSLELATIDAAAPGHGDERVLVVGKVKYKSTHGLGVTRIYVLSPSRGLCYVRRSSIMDDGDKLHQLAEKFNG